MSSLRWPSLVRMCVLCCFAGYAGLPLHAQDSSKKPAEVTNTPFLVNGSPYRRPSAHDDLLAYRHELIGPRPFIHAAIRSGIEQIRPVPVGWGQDFPGYLQRYGSAYGEAAIDSSVRFGLAAVLHEDVRYIVCRGCSAGGKVKNAFLAEFTARHGEDGHRTASLTPVIAGFSGPLTAYAAWYPPGYGPGDAARHATLGFGTRIVFHIAREFIADHKRNGP